MILLSNSGVFGRVGGIGSIIKYKNGKLAKGRKDVLHIWEDYFKELLNQRENSELELPSAVEREREQLKKIKRGRSTGIAEVQMEMLVMAGRVGARWTKRLLNTCMREGKIPEEEWTGLIVPSMEKREMFTTLESTEVSC